MNFKSVLRVDGSTCLAVGKVPTISDIEMLSAVGINVIINLLTLDEMRELKQFPPEKWNKIYYHFPINPRKTPSLKSLNYFIKLIGSHLQQKNSVYIFGRTGLGRCALISSMCAFAYGKSLTDVDRLFNKTTYSKSQRKVILEYYTLCHQLQST